MLRYRSIAGNFHRPFISRDIVSVDNSAVNTNRFSMSCVNVNSRRLPTLDP
ncbi:hypothetical protein WN51_14224 [Melipona quadrifasciata]|uniref:Uncharacterized protein n=1 Tax=Melipona quadrifasciata TaxID=166423 RepID=A0A0N0U535_9HYME|nr:hypothetical protein WN51_14224 [Melipona quadrifasciata]